MTTILSSCGPIHLYPQSEELVSLVPRGLQAGGSVLRLREQGRRADLQVLQAGSSMVPPPSVDVTLGWDDFAGHFVYVVNDRYGAPLYVGRSNNPFGRLGAHRTQAPWGPSADHVVIRRYPKPIAWEVEKRLIADLDPPYNVKRDSPMSWDEIGRIRVCEKCESERAIQHAVTCFKCRRR